MSKNCKCIFLRSTFSLELPYPLDCNPRVLKEAEYDLHNSFFGLCGKKGATGNECITTYSSVPCH